MTYRSLTLFKLLEDIEGHRLLLPHIQRAFVWDEEQMERLFDSLMRNYPIQTLLFWRTKDAIRARRFLVPLDRDVELSELYDELKSRLGEEKTFVLDGQQRLQTLHSVFRGGLRGPTGEILHAHCNLTDGDAAEETGDLLHKLVFAAGDLPLPLLALPKLAADLSSRSHADLAYEYADRLQLADPSTEHRARERRVAKNLAQISSILHEDKHFWIDELDGVAQKYPYQRVLEIFVRVNSGGTKLTAGDLMFAAMKEGWEDIEQRVEQTVELLSDGRLGITQELVLKCLLLAAGAGAEVKTEKFLGAAGHVLMDQMESNWIACERAFLELRDFMIHDLRLTADKIVKTYNALIPLFLYLRLHPQPTPADRALMAAYFYKAQLFGWFGAAGDQILNSLARIIATSSGATFPLAAIKAFFKESRGQGVALSESLLRNKQARALLLNIVYIDTFGASPFDVAHKGNEPHVDHIYPQYMLRKHLGCSSDEINDIGNLRLVGQTDNIRKRAQLPASYFADLRARGVAIEKHLLVPRFAEEPATLIFDGPTYDQFRRERRSYIWRALQRIVDPEVTATAAIPGSTVTV